MKKIFSYIFLMIVPVLMMAQETIYPAPPQEQTVAITNATLHLGNGQVIEKGTLVFVNGKITAVGSGVQAPQGARNIDATGKKVYPGLILSFSDLGLKEVGSGTRSTNDFLEIGDINPNVRAIVAYNSDSKIINTLRSNGILLVNTVPRGGLVSGSSSVVQLDAWNYEDAVYVMDGGIHFNMPSLLNRPASRRGQQSANPLKTAFERIDMVKNFFREAKAYHAQQDNRTVNLKYDAVKGLFDKKQKLFIHCDMVREMLVAVDFVKEFGFDVVILGGSESFLIADLLKKHNLPVILNQMHRVPTSPDDDVDQPFKTPAALQKAGVMFAINDADGMTRGKNLMFNAGTAATYGLTKEQALSAITLNAARILGMENKTGSLEVGKDANIIISEGDILDMKSSIITEAFIQGRTINLDNKHRQLYERYKHKYKLENSSSAKN